MKIFSFNHLRFIKNHSKTFYQWSKRQFSEPSPEVIKRQVLFNHSIRHAIWVETGTYLGDTTQFLSKEASFVYSIEPDPNLFRRAEGRFRHVKNIKIINGLSEEVLPRLLSEIRGEVNFWLDGHDSGGLTHKGPQETPIVDELRCISAHRNNFSKFVIFIDDARLFTPLHNDFTGAYPTLDYLVDWSRENRLSWNLTQDIFIAGS